MQTRENILIVDDDVKICKLLTELLQTNGFNAIAIHDGKQLFPLLETQPIDLILLDIMLPGDNGVILCRKIREKNAIPIIMLTAVTDDIEQVVSMEIGADNYITKPFTPRILLAHIKSLLRRHALTKEVSQSIAQDNVVNYKFSDWVVYSQSRQLISPEGVDISLSSLEYNLLLTFMLHPGQLLTRDQLLESIAGRKTDPFDRIIDVLVTYLRKKLQDNPKKPQFIKTVHNVGYLFIDKVIKVNCQ